MKVLRGPAGARRKNGGIHPFQKLKKDELINECHWRGLPAGDLLKKDLEANLKEHLAGVHRIPALIFHNRDKSMEESGLNLYEHLSLFMTSKDISVTFGMSFHIA